MAGFVHETQLLETHHLVRSLIEDQIGQPVGIAAVFGLAIETVMGQKKSGTSCQLTDEIQIGVDFGRLVDSVVGPALSVGGQVESAGGLGSVTSEGQGAHQIMPACGGFRILQGQERSV